MALRFRLRGLAETFLDCIRCPCCGKVGHDDHSFKTDRSRVTPEGIVVIAECEVCGEIFVPEAQRFGVVHVANLRAAVERDWEETGETKFTNVQEVRLNAERMNSERKSKGLN